MVLAVCLTPDDGRAAMINLPSVADTTLSETYPDNNLGGLRFFNSGTTQNGYKNRGLIRFNPSAAIPARSKITSAKLVLEISGIPNEPPPASDMGLHRVLQSWGEGNKLSPTNCNSCAGQGSLATTNEATWFHRFAFTTNTWSAPGMAATNDYVALASSSTTIYDFTYSPYEFISNARMISDVQYWLDNPNQNFGWALVCEAEDSPFTARRFGSHEDFLNAPRLEVDYLPPPQILSVSKQTNQFTLTFAGEAGQNYVVEYRDLLSTNANWSVLTNIGPLADTTEVVVIDSLPLSNPDRFYRVGLQQ